MDAPKASSAASALSTSSVRYYNPYFSPHEVANLQDKMRSKGSCEPDSLQQHGVSADTPTVSDASAHADERANHRACGFIEAVGSKMGL